MKVPTESKKVLQTCMRLMDAKLILPPIHCILVEVVRVKEAPLPEPLVNSFGFGKSSSTVARFCLTANFWTVV